MSIQAGPKGAQVKVTFPKVEDGPFVVLDGQHRMSALLDALRFSDQSTEDFGETTVDLSETDTGEAIEWNLPSRGPVPSFGPATHQREDGETTLYVMRLHGCVQELFPKRHLVGKAVVKIGRSNDTNRRVQEMNSGIPPGANLWWAIGYVRHFATAVLAHNAEQRLLVHLGKSGKSMGGEFAIVDERHLPGLLGL